MSSSRAAVPSPDCSRTIVTSSAPVPSGSEIDDPVDRLADQPCGLVLVEDPPGEQHTALGGRQPGGQ